MGDNKRTRRTKAATTDENVELVHSLIFVPGEEACVL